MFLDFYGMREQPFGVTPDPRFLFLGRSHREALASLTYGIEAGRGFMTLIAPPGLGKTTLTFQLLEKFQQGCRTVFLFQRLYDSEELFRYILKDLEINPSGMDMVSMHEALNEALVREGAAGRRFILAIDEAQNLDTATLETIRLLSNFETSRAKLVNILLIGQPQLAGKLCDPALAQLRQRIAMFARIDPFDAADTARYISHRLDVAGCDGANLFTARALQMITQRSRGVPRNINSLCFSALSLGRAMNRKRIDSEIMREVVADFDVKRSAKRRTGANPVLLYLSEFFRGRRRWALGAASIIACMALLGTFVVHSASRFVRLRPSAANAASTIKSYPSAINHASATVTPANSTTGKDPSNTTLNIASPGANPDTFSVVVKSGDSLQKIALENLGEDRDELIDKIWNLNPDISDPDEIDVGDIIRLPKRTKPATIPPAPPETPPADHVSK